MFGFISRIIAIFTPIDEELREVAEQLYEAAEQGDAEAQYELGCIHVFQWRGRGSRITNEAVTWFRKAAEQGHAESRSHNGLAICITHGEGVARDYHRSGGMVSQGYRAGA